MKKTTKIQNDGDRRFQFFNQCCWWRFLSYLVWRCY